MSDDIAKAVKDARVAAAVAVLCFFLIGVLFMIDAQRNKVMLEHVQQARRILDEFRIGVSQVVRDAGIEPVASPVVGGTAADGGGTGGDGAAGVVADGTPGTGMDPAGGAEAAPVNGSRGRRAGMAGGPRGDG